MINKDSKFLLRNMGFHESFFDRIDPEQQVCVLKREKLRKVNSENAVVKIENRDLLLKRCREEEDLEVYKEMQDCEIYKDKEDFRTYYDDEDFDAAEDQGLVEIEKPFYRDQLETNFNIFANCSKSQMNKLNKIVTGLNSSPEEKVIVKAYRSKLKSKFYQIYEENSQQFREKIKYKIFHKCNYPSCGRTFASSGWLKSHFQEHLKELKKNKFNILFDELIVNCKKNLF